MVDIDWGDLTPTLGQRARAQARLAELAHLEGPVVALRRRGSSYEAQLTGALPSVPAEVRLSGDDLSSLIERACQFLSVVAHETPARPRERSGDRPR